MTESKTILVVDDDREMREGLKAVLGRHGYRTLEADDGRAARQLIDQHRPDLVILDLMMPRWGGLSVLEHFHGKPDAPRFIMITATEGDQHKTDAEQLGVFDYLRKPFSMDRLLERVGRAMPQGPGEAAPAPEGEGAMPIIRCQCPACGSRIKAPMQLLGQTRPCPRCNHRFVVVYQPEPEGAKLVMEEPAPAKGRAARA
jgi:DNA-binding response OmpR family regulator